MLDWLRLRRHNVQVSTYRSLLPERINKKSNRTPIKGRRERGEGEEGGREEEGREGEEGGGRRRGRRGRASPLE